jgi:hypothetical protein
LFDGIESDMNDLSFAFDIHAYWSVIRQHSFDHCHIQQFEKRLTNYTVRYSAVSATSIVGQNGESSHFGLFAISFRMASQGNPRVNPFTAFPQFRNP